MFATGLRSWPRAFVDEELPGRAAEYLGPPRRIKMLFQLGLFKARSFYSVSFKNRSISAFGIVLCRSALLDRIRPRSISRRTLLTEIPRISAVSFVENANRSTGLELWVGAGFIDAEIRPMHAPVN